MKNIYLFGGAFDMPTLGHTMICTHLLLNEPDLDLILVIPAFQHVEKKLSPFYHRFEMCNRAFSSLPNVQVSAVEADLGGSSKTVVTIKYLHFLHPDWKMRFVLGADLEESFKTWEGWEEIERLAPPIIIGRAGISSKGGQEAVCPAVSSTMVRNLIHENKHETASKLIPKRVMEYINFHELYKK